MKQPDCPLSDTDHKGRTTRYEYDEWGNLLKTTYPDGRKKQTATAWSSPEEPGLFRITAAETGNPLVKTYYDALKREYAPQPHVSTERN